MRARALVLAGLAACGLQEIDLARRSLGDNVLVLDGVPEERVARFAIAGDAKEEPKLSLAYPPEGVGMPANTAPFPLVWASAKMPPPTAPSSPTPRPGGADDVVYELHLRCAESELRVYLARPELTLPVERWRRLLQGHAGATLEVTLRALDGKGSLKGGPMRTLRVRAPVPAGALYYVVEGEGVARADLGELGHELISRETTCAGCRPVARDASVRVVESEPEIVVEALASGTRTPLTSGSALPVLEWASLSPDGTRLIASGQGQLALYGRDLLAFAPGELGYAADPDWSPSAGLLALAIDTRAPGPMTMEAAPNAIARVDLGEDGALGAPTLLAESNAPDETLRAPSFSPDGRFLVFARQKGKGDMSVLSWVDLEAPGAADAAGTELLAIEARAAMPSFIPSTAERDYWLVFSSSRDGPWGKLAPEQVQLWLLGLERQPDDSLKAAGEPFWLPSQDALTSNRRALFAPR